jgi:hypothetical protein
MAYFFIMSGADAGPGVCQDEPRYCGGSDAGAGAAGDTVTREPLTGVPTAMPSNVAGNTFRAISLESQATAELEFSKFVEALHSSRRSTKNPNV